MFQLGRGRSGLRSFVGLVAGVALSSAAFGQALPTNRPNQPFAVGAVLTEVAGDAKVGSKHAGLICAPAGALRWREVEPSGAKSAGAATRVIRDAGVPVVAQDADDWIETRAPSTGYRLIGAVVGVKASVCSPAFGIGRALDHSKRLKGEGRMRVEWRIYRLADHQVVARTETCAPFAFDRTGMTPSDVGQIGVIENARVLAGALARSPGGYALPASLVDGECPARVAGHHMPEGADGAP